MEYENLTEHYLISLRGLVSLVWNIQMSGI